MKILVVTGSSGGHLFPALSFLEDLKDKTGLYAKELLNIDTVLAMSSRGMERCVFGGHKVRYLSIPKIGVSLNFRNLAAFLKFMKGCFQSIFLLIEFRPDIVVGFGALDSVPLVLFAWLFRIKTLIHEQNVLAGRANRLLARFSDRIAVSFTETKEHLKVSQERIVFTGNPIRRKLRQVDKDEALSFFGFNPPPEDALKSFTILVMGGSLGSQRINRCFLDSLSLLPDKPAVRVIHIAGTKDCDMLKESYKGLNIKARVFAFLEDMQYAYSISDLAVCRAGATTIAELINFRLPAILIPYPFAYRHQLRNAQVLEKIGAGLVIEEDGLDAAGLGRAISELIENPQRIKAMRSRYDSVKKTNANDLFLEAVLSLTK